MLIYASVMDMVGLDVSMVMVDLLAVMDMVGLINFHAMLKGPSWPVIVSGPQRGKAFHPGSARSG